jgi:outer membrane lipoprotein carrier protein
MSRSTFMGGFLLLLVPWLWAPPAVATTEADALLRRLESAYERLDTLQAEFIQSLHSMALAEAQRESGVLYVQRPSRMRWEYRQPEKKLAVVDGERTWLYVPAEGQVFVGSLEEADNGVAGLLLADRVDLSRDFIVQALRNEAGEPVPDSVTLIPRAGSEEFERIDVTLSRDSGLPWHIVVHGALGDVMEYRLQKVRTGVALDEDLFRFEPPPGVEQIPVSGEDGGLDE